MQVSHESGAEEAGFASLIVRARDVLRRRWLILSLVTATVFALAVVPILLMSPKYSSTARIRIDPSRTPVADQQNDSSALSPEAIETEVNLLQSADVARTVVRKLNLASDPEFSKNTGQASGAPMRPEDRELAVVTRVMNNLSVSRDKLSYILNASFTSRDRIKSATIANAFADAYISFKAGSKSDSASVKATFLRKQLDDLGLEIRNSEAELANYQAGTGLTATTNAAGNQTGTIVDQQIAPLSVALAQASSDAAAATAQLNAARSQAASGGSDTVAEVLASPVIGQLRAQRAIALQSMGEVMSRYGEKHPETIRVRGQLADIDSQIKAETTRIMSSLSSKAAASQARVASLQGAMSGLAVRQGVNARNSVLATSLQSQLTSKRAQYDKLSQSLLESTQASNNSIASAVIVDQAKPPLGPTSPNKPLLLALAFIVASAAGIGTITVQELMVSGLRTMTDIEERLGVPMLAAIPREKGRSPANIMLEKPTSLFAEALRIARASILGVKSSSKIQVIAITSSLPGEGKTTTALAFARTLAINGQKTLLIDCDVRRASVRELVSDPGQGPGLVELLQKEATLDQVIRPGDLPNLDHLLTRSPYFSSGNLFGDGTMEQLLATLRDRYELIVLDLPPLIGLADGRFIAAMADVVAMIVRWDSTPVQAASTALASLQADGSNVAGVIFSMVDSGAEAIGGLYYSKKYSGYYQPA
jgi:capsular exopolysaccharide synthesis family protein